MPILNSAARVLLKAVPRFISPQAHAVIDYIMVGSFFMSVAWLWPRNKRAALAALICGGAELSVNLLTNYPGGLMRTFSFHRHGQIDIGLAAMAATMPEFLAFEDDAEKKLFLTHGAIIAAVRELTDFPEEPNFVEKARGRARAA